MNEHVTAKSTPRDVFMYLLASAALYWSAFNFVQLVFAHVDRAFPDPLNPYYDPGSSMRWAIASLIIIFPVYLWVTRFLRREIAAHPEKGEIRIRKWLVYLTLFLAALLIIGDLVALIFNFLGGDLTAPFFLKVATVLAVGGAIFGYYFSDLRGASGSAWTKPKFFAWVSIGVVLLAVVVGFFAAGSPFKQRLVRFDSQKVSDLTNIQVQVVNYWQSKEKLPVALTDLEDSISGFVVPVDPQAEEKGSAYTYRVKGPLTFELCAEFNLTAEGAAAMNLRSPEAFYDPGVGQVKGTWNHGEGVTCFERTIDPDLYPKKP